MFGVVTELPVLLICLVISSVITKQLIVTGRAGVHGEVRGGAVPDSAGQRASASGAAQDMPREEPPRPALHAKRCLRSSRHAHHEQSQVRRCASLLNVC